MLNISDTDVCVDQIETIQSLYYVPTDEGGLEGEFKAVQ